MEVHVRRLKKFKRKANQGPSAAARGPLPHRVHGPVAVPMADHHQHRRHARAGALDGQI